MTPIFIDQDLTHHGHLVINKISKQMWQKNLLEKHRNKCSPIAIILQTNIGSLGTLGGRSHKH